MIFGQHLGTWPKSVQHFVSHRTILVHLHIASLLRLCSLMFYSILKNFPSISNLDYGGWHLVWHLQLDSVNKYICVCEGSNIIICVTYKIWVALLVAICFDIITFPLKIALFGFSLGSGLHTFVLYLGPHIAFFTIKAMQCGRVDLKSAPYDTIQLKRGPSWLNKDCSEFGSPLFTSQHGGGRVPLSSILPQVQIEAILWGIGTALGELPPYFISRAGMATTSHLVNCVTF